jgi:hypothetical protein
LAARLREAVTIKTYVTLDSDEAPINALCFGKVRPGTARGIEEKAMRLAKGGGGF